jgi:uncharacterized heparinase superfamily protein
MAAAPYFADQRKRASPMLGKLGLLWRTIRHLRPIQIFARVWIRTRRPKPKLAPPPTHGTTAGQYVSVARRNASLIGPTQWRFLNCDGDLGEIGWQDEQRPLLWRYNQHYFDDLNAHDAHERSVWHAQLIDIWIAENPPAKGTGWAPYPTSLRIVNWVKWALQGNTFNPKTSHSLAVQTRWLAQRIEWHLLGNHLFANAKALVHAGLFFQGAEADRWLNRGLKIIETQIAEQILPDGGQFELTPMYHALAVEDLLDLINILRSHHHRLTTPQHIKLLDICQNTIPAMLKWLATTSHPDGRISFFNDAAFDIAPENSELFEYALRLGFDRPTAQYAAVTDLTDSGLCRLTYGNAVIIIDFAAIGPSYLPGHAHADSLSFEMSLFGQRLFVNSGTSTYATGPQRSHERGTATHNTVVVEQQNSSEIWAGFRVGARAHIQERHIAQNNDAVIASAKHDGYRRLFNGLDHHREFRLTQNSLCVADHITKPRSAQAMFHLHPAIKIRDAQSCGGTLELPNGQIVAYDSHGSPIDVIESPWHPEFGRVERAFCLVVNFVSSDVCFTVNWD